MFSLGLTILTIIGFTSYGDTLNSIIVFTTSQGGAIVALANANPKDDRQLAERLLEYGLAFEAFDMLNSKPVLPGDWATRFASEAREMLPELHVLLRSFATNRGRLRAKQAVAKHKGHVRGSVVRRVFDGSTKGEETRGSGEQFCQFMEAFAFKKRKRRHRSQIDCRYTDWLDPICVDWKPGLGPFGICKFRSCRHFFFLEFFERRGRRAELCPEHRKSKYDMSRKKRRDYMRRYRSERHASL